MTDPRDHNQGDEDTQPGKAPDNEQTIVRGQDSGVSEPNDDATVLRSERSGSPVLTDEVALPNDDATIISSPRSEANNDETIVRAGSSSVPSEGNDEATVLRPKTDSGSSTEVDETVVRKDSPGHRKTEPDNAATILRSPGPRNAGEDSATILRAPVSDSATILREPGEDGVTILRGGGSGIDEDDGDATILRAGDDEDDDDRTIMNPDFDDDSTIIGGGADGQDTTYIASVGKQQRPTGNSEAGRLLKNRFVLEEKIGSGGMGDVYKALDLRQQEAQERDPYIAIKLLNESFARHKDAFLSLQRETSRTRGIPHPNIMGVYDFDREGDTVFMSMELLDGKPLDDFLKEHPEGVSVEDAWNIIDGISQGLMRAHNAGIVHSDFKPGNIFYTKDKTAKVFDFGIARAVSNPNELEADGEKTVFDAGSLGALTPTYASYEMLKGLEPSKSDDVYAVALVAYELFMGKHPYDRVPADKAFDRGLKPKPVPFLKRRHWKALRKALELKGEDRTQSIDEFYEGIFSEDPPYLRYAAVAVLLSASIGFGAYQTLNVKEKPPELVQFEEVASGARLTVENSLRDIQTNPGLWNSDVWHDALATAFIRWKGAELTILENEEWVEDWAKEYDPDIDKYMAETLDAYLKRIELLRTDAYGYSQEIHPEFGVEQAIETLEDAADLMARIKKSYQHADSERVAQQDKQLQVRLKLRNERLAVIRAEQLAEEQRLAAELKARQEAEAKRQFETQRLNQYTAYLEDLREILKCKGGMPPEELDELGVLLNNLQTEWPEAYEHHYPTFVGYLSTCIQQRIGYVDPEEARQVQARVVSYLPGEQTIANLVIEDKDPCADRKLVGRGDRNQRWCSDPLSEGGTGPEMVVIPAITVKAYKYAISRAEIKVHEYNHYCKSTGCQQYPEELGSLPVTNLSLDEARTYADWLSRQTGQTYRLPSVEEWSYAVRTDSPYEVDKNINCTVDSRGVRLGENLLNAISGKSNPWGLYNFVGNAQEWALDEDGLVALGGAHTDPRNECSIDKAVAHEGNADPVTGFRLIREIEDKDAEAEKGDLAASG